MKAIKLLIFIMFIFTIYNLIFNGSMTYDSDGLYFVFSLACMFVSFPGMMVLLFKYTRQI